MARLERMRCGVWILAVTLLVSGCGGGAATFEPSGALLPPTASSTPVASSTLAVSATPAPSTPAHWTLVSFSDSAFGNGDDGNVAAIDDFARFVEQDLGVSVTVKGHWLGGYTSDEMLTAVRSDGPLRADLASADIVVFEVPIGELRFECPFDNTTWLPTPDPKAWRACVSTVVERNTRNSKAIVDELVKLRSPRDAIIRAVTLWEFGYLANLETGIEPAMRDIFTESNAGVAAAAGAEGIAIADGWKAFMGQDGKSDPYAAGYVLASPDLRHLTPKGAVALATVLRDLGYAKAG